MVSRHYSPDLEGEEESILREFDEWLPRKGDRLFVESVDGVQLDPLRMRQIVSPGEPVPGRRQQYSEGYLLAGNRIVESLTGSPFEHILIYPVLYVYRHHLELELKGLLSYYLYSLSGLEPEKLRAKIDGLKQTHSLQSLWDSFQHYFPKWKSDFSIDVQDAFRSMLRELDEHDPTGEAGRYETDRQGHQNLARLTLVDLKRLKLGIHKMSHVLRAIYEGIGQEVEWRLEMESW